MKSEITYYYVNGINTRYLDYRRTVMKINKIEGVSITADTYSFSDSESAKKIDQMLSVLTDSFIAIAFSEGLLLESASSLSNIVRKKIKIGKVIIIAHSRGVALVLSVLKEMEKDEKLRKYIKRNLKVITLGGFSNIRELSEKDTSASIREFKNIDDPVHQLYDGWTRVKKHVLSSKSLRSFLYKTVFNIFLSFKDIVHLNNTHGVGVYLYFLAKYHSDLLNGRWSGRKSIPPFNQKFYKDREKINQIVSKKILVK